MAVELPQSPTGEAAKSFGAYYTDMPVAEFLVRWAVRSPSDTVLDPSFGGGVFLHAASEHLRGLEGDAARQVFGVELDPEVHARSGGVLREAHGTRPENLLLSDFFDVEPATLPPPSAVVGNPPFIRYQRFSGDGRGKAMGRAAAEGVGLSKLASSWAPFLVHSAALLAEGGRLGMVIPVELGHAAYARPVLDYLARSFGRVTFLTFRKKLFPDLSQDTLLVLGEEKKRGAGIGNAKFYLLDLESADDLRGLDLPRAATHAMDAEALASGRERLIEYWISPEARRLYRGLRDSAKTVRLGELADVGIGYVTGDNAFFHLSPDQAREWDIPAEFLKPAVRRGRALSGLKFTAEDWREGLTSGETGHLLYLSGADELPEGVRRYVEQGEADGVNRAYKCRVRKPWYAVPHVHLPDAFLTYMSGEFPRLVANDARAVAPNSLHVLRLHPEADLGPDALACLWQTSLTRLSAELEGHAMGGGMLKLEPTEAENVVLARPNLSARQLESLAAELDALSRSGGTAVARALADRAILEEGLGLERQEQLLLAEASTALCQRRHRKAENLV